MILADFGYPVIWSFVLLLLKIL